MHAHTLMHPPMHSPKMCHKPCQEKKPHHNSRSQAGQLAPIVPVLEIVRQEVWNFVTLRQSETQNRNTVKDWPTGRVGKARLGAGAKFVMCHMEPSFHYYCPSGSRISSQN